MERESKLRGSLMGKSEKSVGSELRGTLLNESESENTVEECDAGLKECAKAITDQYEKQMRLLKGTEQLQKKVRAKEVAKRLGIDFSKSGKTVEFGSESIAPYDPGEVKGIVADLFTPEEIMEFDAHTLQEEFETYYGPYALNLLTVSTTEEVEFEDQHAIKKKMKVAETLVRDIAGAIQELQEESTSPE